MWNSKEHAVFCLHLHGKTLIGMTEYPLFTRNLFGEILLQRSGTCLVKFHYNNHHIQIQKAHLMCKILLSFNSFKCLAKLASVATCPNEWHRGGNKLPHDMDARNGISTQIHYHFAIQSPQTIKPHCTSLPPNPPLPFPSAKQSTSHQLFR